MKTRVIAAAAAAAAASVVVLTALPASASSLDGKDPYSTGCNSSAYSVRSASIKNQIGDSLGSVYLYWSPTCKTNWTEVRVSTSGHGSVNVYTDDGRSALFSYSAGNGGHHWGNMLYAPGVCAWGTGTVVAGTGTVNHGSGTTADACG
ncbi:hypothetical protein Psi02_66650 [Planotetraspora silvatica]|uniref:DUF2690 domain-containing protein n=1 Tax=Planotetraspora silvatica TaxID=234614 RepID=A0A8J3XS86_9ACTN|nr:DUF2690 domain-containing protein [Planotetraspora silvatica]GII50241.1 hypothetical protein Psi02_66650 [Planotetraspora silvatica]